MTFKKCSVFALFILAGATSYANVIDFNALSGAYPTYTEQGVTFSPIGTGSLLTAVDPNGTTGIYAPDGVTNDPIRADISGGATSVSVDLGDFAFDADLLYLEIFNSADVSLGSTTLLTDISDSTNHTLTLSAADIAYAKFGAPTTGNSVVADNFTWTGGAAVPEPGAIFLTASGLFALVLRRRVRKS